MTKGTVSDACKAPTKGTITINERALMSIIRLHFPNTFSLISSPTWRTTSQLLKRVCFTIVNTMSITHTPHSRKRGVKHKPSLIFHNSVFFLFFKIIFIYTYIYIFVWLSHNMYVCMCVPESQKRALDSLSLESQAVLSHVGKTLGLFKERKTASRIVF